MGSARSQLAPASDPSTTAQAQKKIPEEENALLGNHPKQLADIVASRTEHRVKAVTHFPFERAAVHPVVTLEVPDDGLNGLTTPELLFLLDAEALVFAPVDDTGSRIVRIHASIAQIDEDLLWRRSLSPALYQVFIGCIEGILEVEQANHDPQRDPWAPRYRDSGALLGLFTEMIEVRRILTDTGLTFGVARDDLGNLGLQALPRHP